MANGSKPTQLKFSLDERVFFRKGDEISELISLAIEPDVTIQELDHYISIRGSLDINGEFKKSHGDLEEDEDGFSFSGQKFAQVIEAREEGVCEFSYEFPVDITIPKSRVKDVEELSFNIDSFDYDLLESNTLKVTTDITISGVYEEDDSLSREEEGYFEEIVVDESLYSTKDYGDELSTFSSFGKDDEESQEEEWNFSATARKSVEQKDEDYHVPIQIIQDENSNEATPTSYQFAPPEEYAYSNEYRNDESSYEQDPDRNPNFNFNINFPFGFKQKTQKQSEQPTAEETETNQYDKNDLELPSDQEYEEIPDQQVENIQEDVEEEVETLPQTSNDKAIHYKAKKKKISEKQGISIKEFLARKDDEKKTARMKVYIVQQNDSLGAIADKYDVNISQLLRVNRLENPSDVHEGQVLYIPQDERKKKVK